MVLFCSLLFFLCHFPMRIERRAFTRWCGIRGVSRTAVLAFHRRVPRVVGRATRTMTSLLCLPVIVCNLGVEMLYVLEQRLRAQSVSDAKSQKVLHDVTRAMFAPEFVNELFTPQQTYSQRATREIFDKLAHTSIMRLSESSMDKLYDLMTMGFKFQLVTCTRPEDILNVTLLHLATLRSYLTEESVIDAVNAVDSELRATYGMFQKHEWLGLRRELFRFLGNKRVKVSLLLHEKVQLEDGRMRLPTPTREVHDAEHGDRAVLGPVGTVRLREPLKSGFREWTESIPVFFDGDRKRKFEGAPRTEVAPGGNMYSPERQVPCLPPPLQTLEDAHEGDASGRDAHGNVTHQSSNQPSGAADRLMASASRESSSAREMNLLAGLIRGGGAGSTSKPESDTFKLTLFGEASDTGDTVSAGGKSRGSRDSVLEVRGDAGKGNEASGLADVMKSFGIDDAKKKNRSAFDDDDEEEDDDDDDDEDDLLALMDGAS